MTLETHRSTDAASAAPGGPETPPSRAGTRATPRRPFAPRSCGLLPDGFLPAVLLLAGLLLVSGCEQAGSDAEPEGARATLVDSIFTVEEEIRRFRETLGEAPDSLRRAAPGRDALVLRFVAALQAADTAALAGLALDPAEFAWFYYPDSRYTRRPYRLGPALVWYQLQNRSGRGLTRLLRRYGGHDMGYVAYDCPEAPVTEGESRYWHGCEILHTVPDEATGERAGGSEPVRIRLFGSIMEREGRYKLVGFSNDL
ncbi:MAG: hypothetical protein WDZ89_00840 [Gemmatimonadota bacterium]